MWETLKMVGAAVAVGAWVMWAAVVTWLLVSGRAAGQESEIIASTGGVLGWVMGRMGLPRMPNGRSR